MTSKNDITGDDIATKNTTNAYRDGWDRIFGKKLPTQEEIDNGPHGHLGNIPTDYKDQNVS